MIWLATLVAVSGAVYFLVRTIQSRSTYRSMSQIEINRVELEAARARDARIPVRERILTRLREYGYGGDAFPLVAAGAFVYLLVSAAITLISPSAVLAYVLALPAVIGGVLATGKILQSRRRRRFQRQLVDLLELLAGQIEGGTGAQRALEIVTPNLDDPIRSELIRVLNSQRASRDLVASMKELSVRYPSRALDMFISALEIDQVDGHAIAPAIRQAATLLNSSFQLRAEALAEISQQRNEFMLILALVLGLGTYMIFGMGPEQQASYATPLALTGLALGLANVGWGVWRLLATVRNLEGGTQ